MAGPCADVYKWGGGIIPPKVSSQSPFLSLLTTEQRPRTCPPPSLPLSQCVRVGGALQACPCAGAAGMSMCQGCGRVRVPGLQACLCARAAGVSVCQGLYPAAPKRSPCFRQKGPQTACMPRSPEPEHTPGGHRRNAGLGGDRERLSRGRACACRPRGPTQHLTAGRTGLSVCPFPPQAQGGPERSMMTGLCPLWPSAHFFLLRQCRCELCWTPRDVKALPARPRPCRVAGSAGSISS